MGGMKEIRQIVLLAAAMLACCAGRGEEASVLWWMVGDPLITLLDGVTEVNASSYQSVEGYTDGLVIETADDSKKYIALMTEFQMDESGRRYCFYRCMLTRPSVTGATVEATATPQTETVNITISPRPDDKVVKVFCDKDADARV